MSKRRLPHVLRLLWCSAYSAIRSSDWPHRERVRSDSRVNPILAGFAAGVLSPLAAHAEPLPFDSPGGPQFTPKQTLSQREAGARIVPLVLEAFHAGADHVRIPAGDYRFGKERWGRDGAIYPLEFTGLRRDDAHPFTIDATGATFWFELPDDQAPTAHFCVGFKECRNIVFKGATLDRATRGHVEGRITQFDFAGNRLEIELSPGLTVPDKFNGKLEQRVIPFKADGTFCAPLYALQRGGVHLKYKHISPADTHSRCWSRWKTTDCWPPSGRPACSARATAANRSVKLAW